jgi:hypothetical protein
MKKTGKISVLVLTAVLSTLILSPMIKPAHAYIEEWAWTSPYVFKGYDNYYSYYIIAYTNGSTVTIKLPVRNTFLSPNMNVSWVSIVFDWGFNVTVDLRPNNVTIDEDDIYFFTISFTANLDDLPNNIAHTYTFYVHFVDPYEDDWTTTWSSFSYPYYKLVVFSPDQSDAKSLGMQFWNEEDSFAPYQFSTVSAHLLASQGVVAASQADQQFSIGNFTYAKTLYQTALSLYDQAFAAEQDQGVSMQSAELNATVKTADAAMLEAQAVMNQSYGYILLGLGIVLVGLGAILYGARKPKTATS